MERRKAGTAELVAAPSRSRARNPTRPNLFRVEYRRLAAAEVERVPRGASQAVDCVYVRFHGERHKRAIAELGPVPRGTLSVGGYLGRKSRPVTMNRHRLARNVPIETPRIGDLSAVRLPTRNATCDGTVELESVPRGTVSIQDICLTMIARVLPSKA